MTAGTDLRLLRAAVFTAACVVLSAAGHMTAAEAPIPLWTLGTACALVLAAAVPLAGRERSLPGIAAALAAGQAALHVLFSLGHTTAQRPPTGAGTGTGHGELRALAARLLCGEGAAPRLSTAEARRVVADAGLAASHAAGTAHTVGGHTGSGTHHTAVTGPAPDTLAECVRATLDTALAQWSLPMLLGHLAAACAAGWLLRRGEAALWRLVRLSSEAAWAARDALTVRALRTAVRLLRALLRGVDADHGGRPRTAPAPDRTAPPSGVPLTGAATRRGPPPSPRRFDLAA